MDTRTVDRGTGKMIIENFGTCLRRSFQWKGRANRSEFWYFVATATAITTALGMLAEATQSAIIAPLVELVVAVALVPASVAVTVRRLHDRGRSARWVIASIMIWLITMVAFTAMAVMLAIDLQAGEGFAQVKQSLLRPGVLITSTAMVTTGVAIWITILVMTLRKGDPKDNAYGDPP